MARPRTEVDEKAILDAHHAGVSMSALAIDHDVDRYVIRRVITEAGEDATVLAFPSSYAPVAPPGQVTTEELRARSGISYRQADYWVRAGYLHTSTASKPGSGNARFYPVAEIAVAALVHRLVDEGLNPQAAFRITRDLTETGTALLAGIRIDLPQEY